jgi:hypothetical protein
MIVSRNSKHLVTATANFRTGKVTRSWTKYGAFTKKGPVESEREVIHSHKPLGGLVFALEFGSFALM